MLRLGRGLCSLGCLDSHLSHKLWLLFSFITSLAELVPLIAGLGMVYSICRHSTTDILLNPIKIRDI